MNRSTTALHTARGSSQGVAIPNALQQMIPVTLTERLRNRKVIPFAGAGVSVAVKSKSTGESLFPSWRQLLLCAAQKLVQENKSAYGNLVRNLLEIEAPDFLQAAKYARDGLGAGWFEFLKNQFDHSLDEACDASLDLGRAIWALGSNMVVTTNYDRVLRWTCPNPSDVAFWSVQAPAEQVSAMRNGLTRPAIWHLHGQIDDATNVILTPDGYDRLYPSKIIENGFTASIEVLRYLLASQSFLFVGFSLNDEAFGMQLRAISEMFGGSTGPHYALIHCNSVDHVRSQNIPGLEIIPFAEFGVPLANLVWSLAPETTNPTNSGDVAVLEVANETTSTFHALHSSVILESFDESCDTPPSSHAWVGRHHDLAILRDPNARVIAITGIGGQGKSSLAAKYLEERAASGELWDWRDCKEESNTLHTHLVRLIERLTKGQRHASELSGERIESVVKLFLNTVLSLKGVFVFDNIDQYIDVYRSKAVDEMNFFIEAALRSPSSSRFVFTARPKINYEHSSFLHIELAGLTPDESKQLFLKRGLDIDVKNVCEVHELTQGHPLWLNLIAMQVLTNRVEIGALLARIRAGKDAGLPESMLYEIWRTLSLKHQIFLRYLAELVRPETESQIALFVSKQLNRNQFGKAMRRLRSLDLLVVKSPSSAPDTFELHPLLREFVRRRYTRSERNPYISAILVFFDRIVVKLRPKLAENVSFDDLQNWTAKIELLINSGDCKQALVALDEARRPLLTNGYSEEFIRLATALFASSDPIEASSWDQKVHDDLIDDLVHVLSQLGRFRDADHYVERLSQTVSGATARYVALCDMRSYTYWSRGEMEHAKEWGKRGVEVKDKGNLDTRHDCGHTLALAQRDSNELADALAYFLGDTTLEDAVNPCEIDNSRGGAFYGNIGRCLYFQGNADDAMTCLVKSAWLLERAKDSLTLLNQGWAAHWLGDICEASQPDLAYIMQRRASIKWRLVSPFRADLAQAALDRIKLPDGNPLRSLEDWQIDRRFIDWLNEAQRFL